MDALEDLRWERGAMLSEYHQSKLNNPEVSYFQEYNKLLSNYMSSIDFEITSNLLPPKKLKTEVAVIENIGEIATQNGTYNLLKNTRQYVNVNDVELMIRRGQVVPTGQ